MVKGHTSSVASLGQHAIKVVFTAGREEPRTPRHAEKMDQMDKEGRKNHNKCQFSISHYYLPPELSVNLESVVHNTIQTFDEAVEVLHLLCHVLVVLQSLVILPGCGRDRQVEKRVRERKVYVFKIN